jgi:hypothetical protein
MRVTTEFIPAEDRVRMAGVADDEQPVVKRNPNFPSYGNRKFPT